MNDAGAQRDWLGMTHGGRIIWAESDDDVPRGGTDKPDTHRLREMLIEVNQP
jgi:hypothetical protein